MRMLALLCSLRENYGSVFSLKLGSYKFVMASSPEAVKEMLVKKSTDYAGRPQTYSVKTRTLGMTRAYFNRFRTRFLLVPCTITLLGLERTDVKNGRSICCLTSFSQLEKSRLGNVFL